MILFENKQEAGEALELIRIRLAEFGLKVAEEKTHITDLTPRDNDGGGDRRQITFLGMNVLLTRNRKGTGWKVTYQTEGKRFSRAKARVKERIKRIMRLSLEKQAEAINSYLEGHFNYYGLPGNSRKLKALRTIVIQLWRRWLGRRSQRSKINWNKMDEILQNHPLISPRLKITYRQLGNYAML